MPHNRNSHWLVLALVVGIVILVDQTTKLQAVDVTSNPGIGLGLAAEYVSQPMVVILTLVVLLLFFFMARSWWQVSVIATGTFLGGAVSNMLDRIFFGGVRDWLTIPVMGIRNNLADWAIFLGLAWILRTLLKKEAQKETI